MIRKKRSMDLYWTSVLKIITVTLLFIDIEIKEWKEWNYLRQLFNEYKSGNFRDLKMSSEKTKTSFVKLAKGSKLKKSMKKMELGKPTGANEILNKSQTNQEEAGTK